jgi:hypothetical protein
VGQILRNISLTGNPMTRCIIHIGTHKTGTTSIQRRLDGFKNGEFYYARLAGHENHSLPIFSLFAPHPERHALHRAAGRDAHAVQAFNDQIKADLEKSITKARDRTLLISGEDIGYLPEGAIQRMHDYLKTRVDEVEIVAYVRSPAAYMASHFQERVKNLTIDWFDPARMYRNYRDSFSPFDRIFGRDKVQLWKFDPKAFPDGCVVQDFSRRLGINVPSQRVVRLNESLSREATAALYTYAKLGQRYGATAMRGGGMKLGRLLPGSKFRFSPEAVRPVLAANQADLAWIDDRLGQSLAENLGEPQSNDIRSEEDLLQPDPQIVQRLKELLGRLAPPDATGETPDDVARLMHALRQRFVEARPDQSNPLPISAIRIADILTDIQRNDPSAFDGVPRERAEQLVQDVFQHIVTRLAGTRTGFVTYAKLGRFRVTEIEKEIDGRKTVQSGIGFRPVPTELKRT